MKSLVAKANNKVNKVKIANKMMLFVCSVASVWSLNSFADRGHHGGGNWRERHPARAHQNQQLRQERREVRQAVREGEMTKKEAHEQMREINQVQRKQNEMARENQNGGHLTKDQVKEIHGDIKDLQK